MNSSDYDRFMMGMHVTFIFIRANIEELYCEKVIKIVIANIQLLLMNNQINYQCFCEEVLAEIHDIETKQYLDKAFCSNEASIGIKYEVVKLYIEFIKESLVLAIEELHMNNKPNAYHIVDAVHFLPQVLVEKDNWNKTSFWNTHIKGSEYKWDEQFLAKWEKQFLQPKSLKD
ncbi:hypothetical protein [Paenibacillus eucommiae]|uniref:Uncharacterized protein n=1 Tax=Paenibacillus eucommiae TaxID=1355755 RepID=A0ABS4IM92_9BACL|nr:hypothetical protein [Paenibacillus eucommiae]MBP1988687.1 hypothetical protein [Paenibacillus eucommiae]